MPLQRLGVSTLDRKYCTHKHKTRQAFQRVSRANGNYQRRPNNTNILCGKDAVCDNLGVIFRKASTSEVEVDLVSRELHCNVSGRDCGVTATRERERVAWIRTLSRIPIVIMYLILSSQVGAGSRSKE